MQNKQKYFIVSEHSFPRQWIMHTLDDISRHSEDAFGRLTTLMNVGSHKS